MHSRVSPPKALRVAVHGIARDHELPVGVEGDTGGECRDDHEDVGNDNDNEEDLASHARPFEGKNMDVEGEDGEFRAEERKMVR